MKKITYVCLYSIEKFKEERYYPLSGALKIESIFSALADEGFMIDIVSLSPSHGNHFCKGYQGKISNNITLKLFSSFGRRTLFLKIIDRIWMLLQLCIYFLRYVKKDSLVITYHSMFYVGLILKLKQMIDFKLILELEEIYADVSGNEKYRRKEIKLIDSADGFILPTELLKSQIKSDRPSCIIHGTYKVEKESCIKERDDLIHIVYAGTLDPRKGSIEAIRSAEYLSDQYMIHILGTGSKEEVNTLNCEIKKVNKKRGAEVRYEGLKMGDKYLDFLQGCDIGLCTQDPSAAFTNTSFPSKILSYLSNGLRVLSIRIPAIENSNVGKIVYFYDRQEPNEIAKAILNIDVSEKYDSRKYIKDLYDKSRNDLTNMIKEIM